MAGPPRKNSPARLRQIRLWKAQKRGTEVDADGFVVHRDRTRLHDRIASEVRIGGRRLPLDTLTVMTPTHDPYRIDTRAGHRNGRWFKEQIDGLLSTTAIVHLRGLHYVLVTAQVIKPHNGSVYRNTDADYQWLCEHVARHARWLGYVGFERIIDERSAPPEVFCEDGIEFAPLAYLDRGSGIHIPEDLLPSVDSAMPQLVCPGAPPRQPYRIVLIGEKVSLKPILLPVAERVRGELILPTGEISDTLLNDMIKRAAADDRPTVVLYFSDFDPAGYHMPVVVSRKLQTLCDLKYPGLEIGVYPVALNYRQIVELDLPSTPLKETELRGDGWRAHWGREQTEIDALAALQPDTLRAIADAAVAPFYDATLERRCRAAETQWLISARQVLQEHPGYAAARVAIAEALDGAEAAFAELQSAAETLTETQQVTAARLDVAVPEPYAMPAPELTGAAPEPLYSSRDDWRAATEKLIAYRDLAGDELI